MGRWWLFFVLVFCCVAPAHASNTPGCKLPRGIAVDVVDATDGGSLRLADGREVRLLGLHVPQQAIGRAKAEPFATDAHSFLSGMVKQQRVLLHQFPNRKEDRYGRLLAHVTRESDGIWLQGRMIETGHARVEGTRDSRTCLSTLLEKEDAAREAGQGLWSQTYYSVRRADDIDQLLKLEGSFQLVEGIIVSVAQRNKRLFFNFADDWRTDFTVTVEPMDARLFRSADKTLSPAQQLEKLRAAWEGKRVRVRGWLSKYNGPGIQASYPEQIEFLEGQAGAERGDAR